MHLGSPRRPTDPIVDMLVPRLYGGIPTIFGAPLAESIDDLRGVDIAFLGIPWQAPTPDIRTGRTATNYAGTLLTPAQFRSNSLRYGGYLPELALDVFEHVKIVDRGDAEIVRDMSHTLRNVEDEVRAIIRAGCYPITIGGNSGPSTYPVVKAVAAQAGGPTAVLNFDAHHDNLRGEWEEDDPRRPPWGWTWARRILALPSVDPAKYYHVGLRGPMNDRDTFERFIERGVKPEHIYTYRQIKQARRAGFDEWAQDLAQRVADSVAKVWIAVDPDVLNLGSTPDHSSDFSDEPLGPTVEEMIEIVYRVGHVCGREKFGGLAFAGVPHDAPTIHAVCIYILLYTLAGVISQAASSKL